MKHWPAIFLFASMSCFAQTPDGFAVPQPGRVFEFPRDHGSHPEFRTEWWYVTGHLDAPNGERFGFQVTFFRQAAIVKGEQLFLAHCALLDANGKTFLHEERLNRQGWDAAASTTALDVRNGNWSLRMSRRVGESLRQPLTPALSPGIAPTQSTRSSGEREPDAGAQFRLPLPGDKHRVHLGEPRGEGWGEGPLRVADADSSARPAWGGLAGDELQIMATIRNEAQLTFTLKAMKPLVFFGKDGVSRKGSSPNAASHYLTWPRLEVRGTLRTADKSHDVRGEAWMDHEFSSSQLDEGQVGWDWASMQLNDGREVMVYRIRRTDGSSDPAGTTLAWIDKSGGVRHIDATKFTWTPTRTWTSPKTKAAYPIEARIEAEGQTFVLRPLHDAQELGGEVSGLPYWEGACDVLDARGAVIGRAFLELAGYAGDLAGRLRGK